MNEPTIGAPMLAGSYVVYIPGAKLEPYLQAAVILAGGAVHQRVASSFNDAKKRKVVHLMDVVVLGAKCAHQTDNGTGWGIYQSISAQHYHAQHAGTQHDAVMMLIQANENG